MKKPYPKTAKLCCPRCNGMGFILVNNMSFRDVTGFLNNKQTKEIRNNLRKLKKQGLLEGLSLRKIGKLIGIRSAQIVKHHLLMTEKIGWEEKEWV